MADLMRCLSAVTLNIGPYSEAINRAARFRAASSVNNV